MTLWIMKSLHHWFGVVFAAFFFVIALSGVWVTVDKYIWQSVSKGDYRQTVQNFDKETEKSAISSLFETFANDPIENLEFPKKGLSVFKVTLVNGESYYLNQKTFEKIRQVKPRYKNGFMIRVHKTLLNPFGVGHDIVVWTGLIGVFLTVLGVIVFIPQWRTFRKDRLFLPKDLTFRETRRSHVSTGIIFSVFVVFFGFTGWAIGEPSDATAIFQSFETASRQTHLNNTTRLGAADTADMINEAIDQLPDQRLIRVRSLQDGVFDLELNLVKRGKSALFEQNDFRIDQDTGAIISIPDDENQETGSKITDTLFALHSGDGMSLFYKIFLCIFGIIIGFLSLTGLVSYILKWKLTIQNTLNKLRAIK